jgi:hypothetical protein
MVVPAPHGASANGVKGAVLMTAARHFVARRRVSRFGLAVFALAVISCVALVTPAFAAYPTSYPFVRTWSTAGVDSSIEPYGISYDAILNQLWVGGNGPWAAAFSRDGLTSRKVGAGFPDVFGAGVGLDQVRGVAVDGEEVWLSDYSNGVAKFDTSDGDFTDVFAIGAETPFANTTAIAVDAAHSVYVADGGGAGYPGWRVSKLDENGAYHAVHFGDVGTDPATLMQQPQSVAVAPNFDVYVADSLAGRIWRYRPDALRTTYTPIASWTNALFEQPIGVACGADGSVFVLDYSSGAVTKLSPTGAVLARFGGSGVGPGQFVDPQGLTVASDGRVFVTDRDPKTVTEFRPDLQPVTYVYANLTVKKGSYVSFKYKVTEDVSSKVGVKIKVYKGSSLKATISCGTVARNVWLTKKWKCNLAKGTYTWKVYATDGAGHAQANVASRTLKVK